MLKLETVGRKVIQSHLVRENIFKGFILVYTFVYNSTEGKTNSSWLEKNVDIIKPVLGTKIKEKPSVSQS